MVSRIYTLYVSVKCNIKDSQLIQEYVPNLQISEPYTCFMWFLATARKYRKRKLVAEPTLHIALGTSKGGVDLYSHATGKVESKLKGDGHAGAVTFIRLHQESTLFTCGEDCQVIEWSLDKGSMQNNFSVGTITPTCIVALPISNTLLVGCKELHWWSFGKGNSKLKATFTGHSADIQTLKVLKRENKEFVVTTAKSNREICLWDIGSKAPKVRTFLMEHAASFVSCSHCTFADDLVLLMDDVADLQGGINSLNVACEEFGMKINPELQQNVIRSTLIRLPAKYVPTLIRHLTKLTNQKTANVDVGVRWFRFLLQIIASQLITRGKDGLNDRFGSLLAILEKRTSTLVQLTGLSGRLDFLLNQIKRNTDDDPIFIHENLLVFEDEASDEEKVNGDDDAKSSDVDMVNGDDGSADDNDDDDDSDDEMDDS